MVPGILDLIYSEYFCVTDSKNIIHFVLVFKILPMSLPLVLMITLFYRQHLFTVSIHYTFADVLCMCTLHVLTCLQENMLAGGKNLIADHLVGR